MMHDTGRIVLVHYEDLVTSSEDVLQSICEAIGESFDESMLQFHEGAEAKTSADVAVGWNNLVKPVMGTNFGKYRTGLSRREQQAVERIAGGPLAQLGYPLDYGPARTCLDGGTVGKLYRAGRAAIHQLTRGPAGIRELKQRAKRLKGLREITSRAHGKSPQWGSPHSLAEPTNGASPPDPS